MITDKMMKVVKPTNNNTLTKSTYIPPSIILKQMNSKQYGYGGEPDVAYDGAGVATSAIGGAMSGASAGMSIGGPIGAGVGAVVGLVGGIFTGKKQADAKLAAQRKAAEKRKNAAVKADTDRAEQIVNAKQITGTGAENATGYQKAALGGTYNVRDDAKHMHTVSTLNKFIKTRVKHNVDVIDTY